MDDVHRIPKVAVEPAGAILRYSSNANPFLATSFNVNIIK